MIKISDIEEPKSIKHCIHSLFYTLAQTSRVCEAFCSNYFEEHSEDIDFAEFIILDTVYCYPEICQRDLAKLIIKGTSHTSKLLSSLEKKGLITRPVDTKGNRIVKKILITEKGIESYKQGANIALEFAEQVESIIDEKEVIFCTEFLNKIKDTFSASTDIIYE